MFALRLLENGKTEGETILMTKRRAGLQGWLLNRIILWATKLVGNYFAKGDTQIFKTIKFNLKTPIRADQSILEFIHHVEQQKALAWETWEEVTTNHHSDEINQVNSDISTRVLEAV